MCNVVGGGYLVKQPGMRSNIVEQRGNYPIEWRGPTWSKNWIIRWTTRLPSGCRNLSLSLSLVQVTKGYRNLLHKEFSSWLSALFITEQWSVLALWLASASFTNQHFVSVVNKFKFKIPWFRSQGSFQSIKHKEIRYITSELLSEVCHSVLVELFLQSVRGEQLSHTSANRVDGAHWSCCLKPVQTILAKHIFWCQDY